MTVSVKNSVAVTRYLTPFVSILAWAGIAVMTLFWTLLITLVFFLHFLIDPNLAIAHRLASFWGRSLLLMAPGSRVRVVGKENIPRGRPFIFMANHQSYVDVPTLFFLPGQFKWMADAELFGIPVFGWAMRMAGYIPVRRGNAKEGFRSLARAGDWLSKGISIFVFPEGTRSHTGVLGKFQTGGFRLAAECEVPIVPVILMGTRQLLPRGSWIFRWGVRVQVRILPPIPPSSDAGGLRRLADQTRTVMKQAYRRHLPEVRPAVRPEPFGPAQGRPVEGRTGEWAC